VTAGPVVRTLPESAGILKPCAFDPLPSTSSLESRIPPRASTTPIFFVLSLAGRSKSCSFNLVLPGPKKKSAIREATYPLCTPPRRESNDRAFRMCGSAKRMATVCPQADAALRNKPQRPKAGGTGGTRHNDHPHPSTNCPTNTTTECGSTAWGHNLSCLKNCKQHEKQHRKDSAGTLDNRDH